MTSKSPQKGVEGEILLLSLVLNMLYERWDRIEAQDPDQSMDKWKSYKSIRNTTANVINELAKNRGFDLLKNKEVPHP